MTKGTSILTYPLMLFALASSPLVADTVYTYTGPPFDTVVGVYTTTDRVTGSFTLANPLAPNLPLSDISGDVLSYSFSDGVQTLTNANSAIVGFSISTGPTGSPTGWNITFWETPITNMFGGTVRGVQTGFNGGLTVDLGFTGGTCTDTMAGVCITADGEAGDFGLLFSAIPEDAGFFGHEILDETVAIPVLDAWGLALLVLGLLGAGVHFGLRRMG